MADGTSTLKIVFETLAKNVDATLKGIQAGVEQMAQGVERSTKRADTGLRNLGQAIEEAARHAKKSADAWSAAGLANLGKAIEAAAKSAQQELGNLGAAIEAAAIEAQKAADAGMANLGAAIQAAAEEAQRATDASFSAMAAKGNELGANFESTASSVVRSVERIAMALGAGLVAGITFAGKSISDFNTKLKEIGTIGVASDELKRYEESLVRIADTTSESLVSLTSGLYETISAGVTNAAEATALLDTAQMSAVAGVTNTATTVDLLTVSLNTLGGKLTTSAERIDFIRSAADKWNKVVDIGRIKTEELGKNLGRIAGSAAATGVNIDELGGSIATLSLALPAEQAINALNQTIMKIAAPGEKAKETAKALGIEFGETALASKGLSGVLEDVLLKTGGSSEALKALFEDIDAVRAVSIIGATGIDVLKRNIASVGSASGEVEADFKKMSETLDFQIGNLRNKAVNVLLPAFQKEVFPRIAEAVRDAADFIGKHGADIAGVFESIVGAVSSLVKFLVENKGLILTVLGAIFAKKALDLFLGGIVSLTKNVGGLGDAFTTLKGVATGTITTLNGKLLSGKDQIAAMAGSVATIGTAFLALIPIVVGAISVIIDKIGEAERKLLEFNNRVAEAVNDATKVATTATTARFKAVSSEIEALAATDMMAAKDRASELIAIESETLAKRKANIEAYEARKRTEAAELARVAELERATGFDKGAAELRENLIFLEKGIAAEKAAMAEEVKIRKFLADYVSLSEEEMLEIEAAAAEESIRGEIDLSDKKLTINKAAADARGKLRDIEKKEISEHEKEIDKILKDRARERDRESEERLKAEMALLKEIVAEELEGPPIKIQIDPDDLQALKDIKIPVQVTVVVKQGGGGTEGEGGGTSQAGGPGHAEPTGGGSLPTQPEIAAYVAKPMQDGSQAGVAKGVIQGAEVSSGTFGRVLGDALGKAAELFGKKFLDYASQFGNFLLDTFVRGPISEFFNLLQLASSTTPEDFAGALTETLDGFIASIENLVANLPELLNRLTSFIPEIVQAVVAAIPDLIQTAVDSIGPVIDAVLEAVPRIIDALAEGIPVLVQKIADELPRIAAALGDAIQQIVRSLFSSNVVSTLILAIIESLGELLPAIIELLSEVVAHFMQTLPDLVVALVDMIITELIPSIIREIPEILFAFVDNLPDFIVELVGGIIGSLIEGLPQIIVALVDLLIFKFPQIVGELVVALVEGIGRLIVDIGEKIAEAFRGGIHMEDVGRTIGLAILAVLTGGISEIIRGAANRGRNRRQRQADENEEAMRRFAGLAHVGGMVREAWAGGIQHFAMGGIVDAIQGAMRSGLDDVPIMARAGESVLTQAATQRLGADGVQALNSGGSATPGVTLVLEKGSGLVLDMNRSINSQVEGIVRNGTGRAGEALRQKAGAPVRKGLRFGVG